MASEAVEQLPVLWSEAFAPKEPSSQLAKDELTIEMGTVSAPLRLRRNDSGCDLSSEGSDSPSSYRRLDEESSTGYLTCSSVETTVDQSSPIYQEFTQTLNQARLDNLNIRKEPLILDAILLESQSSASLKPIVANEQANEQDSTVSQAEYYDKAKWLDGVEDGGREPGMPGMPEMLRAEKASRKSRGRLLPQVLASLALAIAAMMEGYSSGYTSPALASMSHPNSTIPITLHEVSKTFLLITKLV